MVVQEWRAQLLLVVARGRGPELRMVHPFELLRPSQLQVERPAFRLRDKGRVLRGTSTDSHKPQTGCRPSPATRRTQEGDKHRNVRNTIFSELCP